MEIIFRKNINETMALQLRIEELTLEMSELNSLNTDLRKQIHNADHLRSQVNRNRVEVHYVIQATNSDNCMSDNILT